MNKEKKLNKLKLKKEKILTILLSDKKVTKQNKKYMSWTLMTPLVLIFLSFIMNCILSSTYTYWLLISSLVLYIPVSLLNLSIQLFGGYKTLLQNRLKNIQNKIDKLESNLKQKNKSMIEEKQKKTWDDFLYTEEEIKQYMQMPEPKAPFNPEIIFKTNELDEKNDDFINDGIDGMSFPNSYEEYGNSYPQVKKKFSGLTKKLSLKKIKK